MVLTVEVVPGFGAAVPVPFPAGFYTCDPGRCRCSLPSEVAPELKPTGSILAEPAAASAEAWLVLLNPQKPHCAGG